MVALNFGGAGGSSAKLAGLGAGLSRFTRGAAPPTVAPATVGSPSGLGQPQTTALQAAQTDLTPFQEANTAVNIENPTTVTPSFQHVTPQQMNADKWSWEDLVAYRQAKKVWEKSGGVGVSETSWNPSTISMANGGLVRRGDKDFDTYAHGGQVMPSASQQDSLAEQSPGNGMTEYEESLTQATIQALDPDSQIDQNDRTTVIEEFERVFGEGAIEELLEELQSRDGGDTPDGTSDSIPALIDGQQPAALSQGEYVLPAWFVAKAGGDTEGGAAHIDNVVEQAKGLAGDEQVDPAALLGLGE